jgi:hypothetical protein
MGLLEPVRGYLPYDGITFPEIGAETGSISSPSIGKRAKTAPLDVIRGRVHFFAAALPVCPIDHFTRSAMNAANGPIFI